MNTNSSRSSGFVSLSTLAATLTRAARLAFAMTALTTAACSATTAAPAHAPIASAASGPSLWDRPVLDARLEATNDVDRTVAARPIHAHVHALAY